LAGIGGIAVSEAFTIKAVQREPLRDIAVEFIECEHTGTVKDLPDAMENQRTAPCYPCGRYRHWRFADPGADDTTAEIANTV
jgi:hypothetical protein